MISCGHETGKGGDVRICYCGNYVVGIIIFIFMMFVYILFI